MGSIFQWLLWASGIPVLIGFPVNDVKDGIDADSMQDHWVAEETREKLLEARGTGVKMVSCEDGLPHGFCICEYL